ncbi:MAG: hypothetical protein HY234_01175 [Acidobacteria bacterium]|nr:hypothetical protein [Acidobacteriota bacterium]
MLNYQQTYSRMGDDDLLRLASQWQTLTEPAQAALGAELESRSLKGEFEAARRTASERLTAQTALSSAPSRAEKVMFRLFVCSAVSAVLFRTIWPHVFDLSKKIQLGLYEIVVGISDSFLLWLIIWLVLRGRRIRKGAQA